MVSPGLPLGTSALRQAALSCQSSLLGPGLVCTSRVRLRHVSVEVWGARFLQTPVLPGVHEGVIGAVVFHRASPCASRMLLELSAPTPFLPGPCRCSLFSERPGPTTPGPWSVLTERFQFPELWSGGGMSSSLEAVVMLMCTLVPIVTNTRDPLLLKCNSSFILGH